MHQDPVRHRHVRLFVASTFHDLGAERHALAETVFPRLRHWCVARGVQFSEIDLRWGITAAEAEGHRVLPICLREIDECHPFFVAIVGDRYGWIPELTPDVVGDYPWLEGLNGLSITHLEIEHGLLRRPREAGQFVYVRAARPGCASNGQDMPRLVDLRKRLEEVGAPVRSFEDAEALAALVANDLLCVLEQMFPEPGGLSPWEREAEMQQATSNELLAIEGGTSASGLEPLVAERLSASPGHLERSLRARLWSGLRALAGHRTAEATPIVLVGREGSGRSHALAELQRASISAATAGWGGSAAARVLVFAGLSEQSSSWFTLARQLAVRLGATAAVLQSARDLPATLSVLERQIVLALECGAPLLLVDGLELLPGSDLEPAVTWLARAAGLGAVVVLSAVAEGRLHQHAAVQHWTTVALPAWSSAARMSFCRTYLARYGKRLDGATLAALANAGADQAPKYLRVVMDELRVVGRHDLLAQQVADNVRAGGLAELFDRVVRRVASPIAATGELVAQALRMLWIARRGLTENELRDLLGDGPRPVTAFVWATVRVALTPLIVHRGGLLSIASEGCRAAVARQQLAGIESKRQVHRRLLAYFRGLQPSRRRFDEAPWHAIATDDAEGLLVLLLEASTLALLDDYGLLQWRSHARWLQGRHQIAAWDRLSEGCTDDPLAMVAAADLCAGLGIWSRAERLYAGAIVGASVRADAALSLRAALGRAAALAETESADVALSGYRDLQRLAAQSGWEPLRVRAVAGEAMMLARAGDVAGARTCLAAALTAVRDCGDRALVSELGGIEGSLLLALADSATLESRKLIADGIAKLRVREQECKQCGDLMGIAQVVLQLAHAHDRSGDDAVAMRLAEEAERRSADLGDHGVRGMALCLQATLLQRGGDLDAASQRLSAAEKLAATVESRLVRARVFGRMAELWADDYVQSYSLAARDCERALAEARAAGAERLAQELEIRWHWYRARAGD